MDVVFIVRYNEDDMVSIKPLAPLICTVSSIVFLIVGAVGIVAIMKRMGKPDVLNAEMYTRIHRIAGWSFVAMFIGLFIYMLTRVMHYNDEFSSIVSIHLTLAIALLCLLAFKVSVPRFFPNLGKHLFLLGTGVYLVAFPMVLISGGYHIEKMLADEPYIYHDSFSKMIADENLGKQFLITKCATCHPLKTILLPRSENSWSEVIQRMLVLARPRISPDEAVQIQAYLVKHYVPKMPDITPNATLVQRHCLPCHMEIDIYRVQYNLHALKTVIRKMSTYDDKIVPPDKVDEIAEYIVKSQSR